MKKFEAKTGILKNGKVISIRMALPDDAQQLMACVRSYLEETEHIPLGVEEFNPSVDDEVKWITGFMNQSNGLMLLACDGDEIVGNIDLTGSPRLAMQHTAMIGMGIRASYRNVGLGTLLMQSAIDWATANPLLQLLWLNVYDTNEGGFALYEKLGFVKSGQIPAFFQDDNKRFTGQITMYLSL